MIEFSSLLAKHLVKYHVCDLTGKFVARLHGDWFIFIHSYRVLHSDSVHFISVNNHFELTVYVDWNVTVIVSVYALPLTNIFCHIFTNENKLKPTVIWLSFEIKPYKFNNKSFNNQNFYDIQAQNLCSLKTLHPGWWWFSSSTIIGNVFSRCSLMNSMYETTTYVSIFLDLMVTSASKE